MDEGDQSCTHLLKFSPITAIRQAAKEQGLLQALPGQVPQKKR